MGKIGCGCEISPSFPHPLIWANPGHFQIKKHELTSIAKTPNPGILRAAILRSLQNGLCLGVCEGLFDRKILELFAWTGDPDHFWKTGTNPAWPCDHHGDIRPIRVLCRLRFNRTEPIKHSDYRSPLKIVLLAIGRFYRSPVLQFLTQLSKKTYICPCKKTEPARTRLWCCTGHYMRPEITVFWQTGAKLRY